MILIMALQRSNSSSMPPSCNHLATSTPASPTTPPIKPRKFSAVDQLSNGRAARIIVTLYLDSAARSFGLDTQVEHDELYKIAHEYLNVIYKL